MKEFSICKQKRLSGKKAEKRKPLNPEFPFLFFFLGKEDRYSLARSRRKQGERKKEWVSYSQKDFFLGREKKEREEKKENEREKEKKKERKENEREKEGRQRELGSNQPLHNKPAGRPSFSCK